MLIGKTPQELANAVWDTIFPEVFPVWENTTCQEVAVKTLLWYWQREIGEETVGMFCLDLQNWLSVNGQKFVDMAKALKESGGALSNDYHMETVNTTEKLNGESNAQHTNTNTSNGSTQNGGSVEDLTSDTPQNGLTAVINGQYLSQASVQNDKRTTSSNGTVTDQGNATQTQDSTKTVENTIERKGFVGDKGKAIMEMQLYYSTIDKMFINEISCLFMGILG